MIRTALLVDDDPSIRMVLSEMLFDLEFKVTEVCDPLEALVALQERGKPTLLVTDIIMPGMDGWTFGELVRAQYPGLPIVYITGYSEESDRPVSRARVVRKPFTEKALARAVAELVL